MHQKKPSVFTLWFQIEATGHCRNKSVLLIDMYIDYFLKVIIYNSHSEYSPATTMVDHSSIPEAHCKDL